MFSTTIKRSVAALGVVAGLLAAAVPASAVGVSLDYPNDALTPLKATANWNGEDTPTETISFVKGPHQSVVVVTGEEDNVAGTQVGSEGVKTPIDDMDLSIGGPNASTSGRPQGVIWDLLEQANAGTQVGSEGVKAPTRADDQVKVSGYTFNPKEIAIDNLRGEAIDIIP